ncbi:MAG: toprim domain-containing protein [Pseudomonadota bacterium]
MPPEKRRLIDIDDIQQRLTVEQVASFYGFALPPNFGDSGEQRMSCPCQDCTGKDDDNSVSINVSDPMRRWKCHREQYGCGAQGRLVMLAYCMKHGSMPPSGKLAGDAFLDIAKDLESVADGKPRDESPPPIRTTTTRSDVQAVLTPSTNKPLSESDNENARKLVDLDQQLVSDLESLSPAASAYARRRSFLLDEQIATEIRTGYMQGSERSSLRSNWVFGVMNRAGEPLAWVGRNVKYEADYEAWLACGRQGREPAKYRFPNQSLFLRGQELYGQEWLDDERFTESLAKHGLLLTEGFTDRVRLHQLGVMSVSMMSNKLTDDQTRLLIAYAREKGHNRVGIMHDADTKGDEGAQDTLWRMHQAGVNAYLVWSKQMHTGKYADRQPESLSAEEWAELETILLASKMTLPRSEK